METIKLEEMRLGNYWSGNLAEGWVSQFDVDDYMNISVNGEAGWYAIPLTEKWLTDFGFVKDGELWHNQIALYEGNPEYPFNYNVCFFEHHNLMTIHHVHQLQNLYFALTGTELTKHP